MFRAELARRPQGARTLPLSWTLLVIKDRKGHESSCKHKVSSQCVCSANEAAAGTHQSTPEERYKRSVIFNERCILAANKLNKPVQSKIKVRKSHLRKLETEQQLGSRLVHVHFVTAIKTLLWRCEQTPHRVHVVSTLQLKSSWTHWGQKMISQHREWDPRSELK